jgi:hypothetical protein
VISILLSPRTRRKFCDYFGTWWISLHIAWHTPQIWRQSPLNLWWYRYWLSPDTRQQLAHYRLGNRWYALRIALTHAAILWLSPEPGDIDIIIALTHAALWLSPRTWWYRYYYRLWHTPHSTSYRLEPGWYRYAIALTHAAIYDYRLEPGDIDIIIARDTRRNSMIISKPAG